jgi:hypothetical protein
VSDGTPIDPFDRATAEWFQLNWASPVTVAQVNLYDRPDPDSNIDDCTLEFSTGTIVHVGPLPADGKVKVVTLSSAEPNVTWVKLWIDKATRGGDGEGLSEIQVYPTTR